MGEELLSERMKVREKQADITNGSDSPFITMDRRVWLDYANDVAKLEDALKMVEWQPVRDPDTNELLGQLCLWCHRKPHAPTCPRQLALGEQR